MGSRDQLASLHPSGDLVLLPERQCSSWWLSGLPSGWRGYSDGQGCGPLGILQVWLTVPSEAGVPRLRNYVGCFPAPWPVRRILRHGELWVDATD